MCSFEIVELGRPHGVPLVFLSGLGSTAHVFDEFAPQFTDHFHVIGITRRGFGASANALPADDPDTLVNDVRVILDSLRMGSVVLVGHSIAGEELARFAVSYPDRCAGLVYLDAAYDRTDSVARSQPSGPSPPQMVAADAASSMAIRAYAARVMGVVEPESEIRATMRFDERGQFVSEVAGPRRKARVMEAVREPQYDRIRCRSLAVYAVPDSPADLVPYYAELDSVGRIAAWELFRSAQAVITDSRKRFARFPQDTVVDLHGNHFIFLQHPIAVAGVMRSFLLGSASRQAHAHSR